MESGRLRIISRVVVENPHLTLFLAGYSSFLAGIAAYSGPLAAIIGGGIAMLVAVWPFIWPQRS